MILNAAIAIVFLLILVIGGMIIFGGDESNNQAIKDQTEGTDNEKNSGNDETESDKDTNSESEEEIEENEDDSNGDTDSSDDGNEQEDVEAGVIVENSDDPNVSKVVIDPSWKPIGTQQTGEHVATYDMNSIDWKEMEQAIAYGANISQENIIYWRIENGGSPHHAVGTVSTKANHDEAYRVYIEWVDQQGWKPTKVEHLKQNDKKQ